MRIAIDTGGTFTDCVYFERDELRVLKIPSTPQDPGHAVLSAVRQIAGHARTEIRHGTTVGTNALLERKGARVAFVTTAGFEDTISIGRQARSKLYDLFFTKPAPLASSELTFGVAERTACDGTILQSPDETALEKLKNAVRTAQPESVAVSLLFSFANPANEWAVAAALRELGAPISVSHEILPEFREYERCSTVVINAYLAPKMQSYLNRLDGELRDSGSSLQVMQSSGGIVRASIAAREPVRTILSGPAGGVVGALKVAEAAGYKRILTFDMGGTSTDVALVNSDSGLRTTTEFQIDGMPVAIPTLNIHTVGAGGGSMASFDAGGALKVGPESAGAVPGPICYGLGQTPTVTDANLLLGRLSPGGLLRGGLQLDEERARERFEKSKALLPDVETFAEGIIRLADAHMEKALSKISIEQGHDPRDFVLLSFGGAGPLHACALARALRIPTVLVPNFPGALSAFGILASDVVRDYSRTVMLKPGDPAIEKHFETLEAQGAQDMEAEGLQPTALRLVDMRYAGQGYELTVSFSADFVEAFHREHQGRFGYADRERAVELVSARVRAIAKTGEISFPRYEVQPGDAKQAAVGMQRIFYGGQWREGVLYNRALLKAGDMFHGPAVVTEYSATTFVPPGASVTVDPFLNLVIQVPE